MRDEYQVKNKCWRKVLAGMQILLLLAGCGKEPESISWTEGVQFENISRGEELAESTNNGADTQADSDCYSYSQDGRTMYLSRVMLVLDGENAFVQDNKTYVLPEYCKQLIPFCEYTENEKSVELSCPVYYFDENALLCIQAKLIMGDGGEWKIAKGYYYPDGTFYSKVDDNEIYTIEKNEKEYICIDSFLEALHLEHSIEPEGIVLNGGAIACENVKNENLYEPVRLDAEAGYIWTTNGTLMKADYLGYEYQNRFTATPKDKPIEVYGNQKLKIVFYSSWFPEVATILYVGDEDNIISYYSTARSTYFNQQILIVPKGATKMYLTFYENQHYKVWKEVEYTGVNLATIDETDYSYRLHEIIAENKRTSVSKEYAVIESNCGNITFVIDDTRYDLDKIIDIFNEYGFPLCAASLYEHLMFPTSKSGETRYDALKRLVDNGGEVLSHSGEVLTSELMDNDDVMLKHFFETDYMLELYGFDVNGIILAGGTGQVVGDSRTDAYARMFYDYSDIYGEQKYGDPYYRYRHWLGNIINSYQTEIDNIVGEKGWRIYYLHDLNEVDEETLRKMLEYISSYGEDKLRVVTYSKMYNKYDD